MRKLILLLAVCGGLTGCVDQGGYYDDPYYSPRSRSTYGGGNQDDYERQQRRRDTNCNLNWQNCAGVCNTIGDATQRAVCIANCNNALNQCKAANR